VRIIVISDCHGRDTWKRIVKKETYDKVVFIGDYLDSFNITYNEIKTNFNNIIDFKTKNTDKVELLIGNHELHYIPQLGEKYSGFLSYAMFDYSMILLPAIQNELIKVAYSYENLLFTHAGVSKTWCENNDVIVDETLVQQLNDLLLYTPKVFKFKSGVNRSEYGDDICQSPLWIRPKSLKTDLIDGYIQIVGHTYQENINIDSNIIITDTNNKEYLIYDNGVFSVGNVKY
jgi:hypothetical protein